MTLKVRNTLAMAACALLAFGTAQAAPLLNLSIQGSTDGGLSWSDHVQAATGATIEIRMIGQIVNGATNGTATVSSFTNSVDGVVSLKVDVHDSSNGTFSNLVLPTPWTSGSGPSVGAYDSPSHTLVGVRPIELNNTGYGTTSPATLLTGSFLVGGLATPEILSGAWSSGGSGSFKFNGGTSKFITSTTEGGTDPLVSFQALTVSAVPEPGSLSLLAITALSLMSRRRHCNASPCRRLP